MVILPSTILDLARYPADAFSALLNMKKQDPVTTIQTERQRDTPYSLCSDDHVVPPSGYQCDFVNLQFISGAYLALQQY